MFFDSIGIGFTNFGIDKSIGIGFEFFWYRKKYRYRFQKNLVSEKVSVSPLRALSACGQILQKNPGKGQSPPSQPGYACILGTSGMATHP